MVKKLSPFQEWRIESLYEGADVKGSRETLGIGRITMQTRLRMAVTIFAAGLLSASMISSATRTKGPANNPKTHSVGIASWYGKQHQGLKMANGKRFDRHKLTAASWYFPLGTKIRVVNLKNGKS